MQYLSAFFDLYLFDLYTGGALRTDNLPAGSLIHAESRKFSVQFLSRPRHWSAFQTPNLYLSMWAESLYLYNIGLRETLVKGEMHDQRVEARPLLGGKDPGDGVRVCRIAAQAVDGLGRKGDELPGAQQFGGARDRLRGRGNDAGRAHDRYLFLSRAARHIMQPDRVPSTVPTAPPQAAGDPSRQT